MKTQPVLTERSKPWKRLPILGATGSLLARDYVVDVAHREPLHIDVPRPSLLKMLYAIWRKDKIKIERAGLELNEIFSANDLLLLRFVQRKAEFA